MKNILVTGGAGFIGSNLVEELLKRGYHVRVLDNLSTGKKENVDIFRDNPNYEFQLGDIRNLEDCLKACEGIDAISHQAALGSVPRSIANPLDTTANNVNGFVNMMNAAKESGVKRMVYASSSSVYGDEPNLPKYEDRVGKPLSPYAASKAADEMFAHAFCKVYDIELIGFRYFNVFGPRQDPNGQYAAVIPLFAKAVLNNESPFINGDGEQSRDFTFVANAVQANILGMTTQNKDAVNQVYNVALGERFTINQLFQSICNYLNKEIQAIHRDPRPGDVRDSLADISKAKNLLGYKPTHQFADGLPITLEYFRSIFER